MDHLRTGRFGRITKNIIYNGFEEHLDVILGDSMEYIRMGKKEKAGYIRSVIERMERYMGKDNVKKVMSDCGRQCCGKSWTDFIDGIHCASKDINDFFELLNIEEKNYGTEFVFLQENNMIVIERSRCLCGLVEKARYKHENRNYCECSTGHFREFLGKVFTVEDILLKQSILCGADKCVWEVKIVEI